MAKEEQELDSLFFIFDLLRVQLDNFPLSGHGSPEMRAGLYTLGLRIERVQEVREYEMAEETPSLEGLEEAISLLGAIPKPGVMFLHEDQVDDVLNKVEDALALLKEHCTIVARGEQDG